MGVVARDGLSTRIRMLVVLVGVLIVALIAFALGRSSSTAMPGVASEPLNPVGSIGTSSMTSVAPPPTVWVPPFDTTTLLAASAVGPTCTAVPSGDELLGCLRSQRDALEVALVNAESGSKARFNFVASDLADQSGGERVADLERASKASEAFLEYRRIACSWSADNAGRALETLLSREAAELACTNVLTTDRVQDLQRLIAGVPLDQAVGWQHPMRQGRVCDASAKFYENDGCGSADLREAEQRLSSVQSYLLSSGTGAPFAEATAAWARFAEDDCASRVALFAEAAAVDRTACRVDAFIRYRLLFDDAYTQIVSFD